MGAWIIGIVMMLVSMLVSQQLKSRFKKYSATPLSNGMSGAEIATQMLNDSGIRDVKVISVPGQLTDHYNPANKTVNLSEPVYHGRNAAAAAVAAHECGHAVQHATAYQWLAMRSSLVPIVNVSSKFMQWVILAGIMLTSSFGTTLLWAGVGLFAFTTLFSLITLPVEYDASNRALAWIKRNGVVTTSEFAMSEDSLKWAARTYVVAAIGSIATLVYYVMMAMGRSRD
ncbi:MAG: zinc metallopeptidase [Flavobacteriales bacterium]|nr:zinc metallopeptidase [Flavobacteriales bacterium]MBL0043293.1 zinc metallopeptidase [Flavobacteriales bacterium]